MTAHEFTVPKHVHWRRFDEELVLIDLKGGMYYGLSEVAATAFELFAQGRSQEDVVAELVELYDVSSVRLRTDVDELVETLVGRSLLSRTR